MGFKMKILSTILFTVMGISVSACEMRDRTCNADSGISPQEYFTPTEADILDSEFFAAPESNDPLYFMEIVTGNTNIIQVNEELDLARLRNLLLRAESGEPDDTGRRFFVYSPNLRKAPANTTDRRMDIGFFFAAAARELRRIYTVDIAVNIRDCGNENVYSFNPRVIELTSDVNIIARRTEFVITYVVDRGYGEYEYGVFYLLSGILWVVDSVSCYALQPS